MQQPPEAERRSMIISSVYREGNQGMECLEQALKLLCSCHWESSQFLLPVPVTCEGAGRLSNMFWNGPTLPECQPSWTQRSFPSTRCCLLCQGLCEVQEDRDDQGTSCCGSVAPAAQSWGQTTEHMPAAWLTVLLSARGQLNYMSLIKLTWLPYPLRGQGREMVCSVLGPVTQPEACLPHVAREVEWSWRSPPGPKITFCLLSPHPLPLPLPVQNSVEIKCVVFPLSGMPFHSLAF